ncbi:MAG: hypothetical protein KC619_05020 [Myxococcales bacterium]|nr:hypothetical protein [Myxococcales bacterium]
MQRFSAWLAALALTGCGLLVDLDPAEDGGVIPSMDAGRADGGMDGSIDASRPDAGPPMGCTEDTECDDGLFCNGRERCTLGLCEAGRPVECDDGVSCTADRCDENVDRCTIGLDDSLCGVPAGECAESRCVPGVGCVTRNVDAFCDDGIDCTVDRCDDGGCTHTPSDGLCLRGQYCSEAAGCLRIPDCMSSGDCPHLPCNASPRCEGGTCMYEPIAEDSECRLSDPCTPIYCSSGVCVTEPPVDCGLADATECTVPVCYRDPSGSAVTCMDLPRGGSCAATMPCHTGTCDAASGVCVETNSCGPPSDACHVSVCTGGGCAETPLACGTNASCVATAGGASCECAPGWRHCAPTETACLCPATVDGGMNSDGGTSSTDAGEPSRPDAGSPSDAGVSDAAVSDPACLLPGRRDCDGNGTCECRSLLSRCSAGTCVCLLTCGLGLQCCHDSLLDIGYCGTIGTCDIPP